MSNVDLVAERNKLPDNEFVRLGPLPELRFEDLRQWEKRRKELLSSADSDMRMWGSFNIQLAWWRLESVAGVHDVEVLSNVYRDEQRQSEAAQRAAPTDVPVSDVESARDRVYRQVALDLQGLRFYFDTPNGASRTVGNRDSGEASDDT
jgi:hypothetical protein